MLKKYIECGKIVTTHGVKGELKVEVWADSPEYLYDFKYLYANDGKTKYEVLNARSHKNGLLLTLKGIDNMDKARELRGQVLYIDRNDDPDDSPYLQDYIGMAVIDVDTKENYGTIARVFETGANNVYMTKDDEGTERLIPAIPQVIIEIDLEKFVMKIRPLEGLFDDAD